MLNGRASTRAHATTKPEPPIAEISPTDLMNMAATITNQMTATVQREVGLARDEIAKDIRSVHARVGELARKQDEQNGRVLVHASEIAKLQTGLAGVERRITDCEADCGDIGQELARVDERTRNVSPAFGITLTPKQKAAVWSALTAIGIAAIDLLRHVIAFVLARLQQGQGPTQ